MYISKSVLAVLAALFIGLGSGYVLWGGPVTVNEQAARATELDGDRPAPAIAGMSEAGIRQIVEDYIIENPVVIMQSVDDYQRNGFVRQIEERAADFVQVLESVDDAATIGDATAPIKIVEFFDYQCPHCKSNYPVLERILSENSNVVLLPKHLPILGDGSDQDMSLLAARAAEAARLQGRFAEFHEALMAREVPLTRASIMATAEAAGLQMDQLRSDIESEAVVSAVDASRAIAMDIGIAQAGTPGYIIGGKVMIGAGPDSYERLNALIDEARGR